MRSLTQNFFQSLKHLGLLRTHLDLRDQDMQHLEPRHHNHLAVLVVPKMWH